jgi:hypothetical protein
VRALQQLSGLPAGLFITKFRKIFARDEMNDDLAIVPAWYGVEVALPVCPCWHDVTKAIAWAPLEAELGLEAIPPAAPPGRGRHDQLPCRGRRTDLAHVNPQGGPADSFRGRLTGR